MERVKFDYDEENDSLLLYREGVKSKGGVEIGDFLIDMDMKMNKVTSLEIMNASKILALQLSEKINKTSLKNIKTVSLKTVHKDNSIYVLYGIVAVRNQEEIKEKSFITVPVRPHAY